MSTNNLVKFLSYISDGPYTLKPMVIKWLKRVTYSTYDFDIYFYSRELIEEDNDIKQIFQKMMFVVILYIIYVYSFTLLFLFTPNSQSAKN